MRLRVPDFDFKEAFWGAVHLFDLSTDAGRVGRKRGKGGRGRWGALTVCSRPEASESSKAVLRAKGETAVMARNELPPPRGTMSK